VSPASLTFNATQNGSLPAIQTVQVTNAGGGTLSGVSAVDQISYSTGATGWLFRSQAGAVAPVTVSLQPNTTNLTPGTYTATISVTAPLAPNSPQTVAVTYIVAQPTARVEITVQPSSSAPDGQPWFIQPEAKALNAQNVGVPGILVTAALASGAGTLTGVNTAPPGLPGALTHAFTVVPGSRVEPNAAKATLGEYLRQEGPLAAAVVTATTGADGVAKFHDLAITGTGTHTLVFSATGFASSSASGAINAGPVSISALNPGTLSNLSGPQNSAQYYSIVIGSGIGGLSLQMSGGTGDADVFLRKNSLPTRADFDCISQTGTNNESISLNASTDAASSSCPGLNKKLSTGTWYLAVFGLAAYSGAGLTTSTTAATVRSITVTPNGTTLNHPTTVQMNAAVTADPGVATTVNWSATPSSVATINAATGLLSTAGAGQVTVTACSTVVTTVCGSATLTVAFALTVNGAGNGSGTVTGAPAGQSGTINCVITAGVAGGSGCSASYLSGVTVTLTATANTGSTFGGWSGACTNASGTCVVTMSQARSVTATFNVANVLPVVGTYPASLILSTSGLLNGWIRQDGNPYTVRFDYGTSSDLSTFQSSPTGTGPTTNCPGTTSCWWSFQPTGLIPNRTYYFRVSATNAAGTSLGAIRSFTTSSGGGSPVISNGMVTLLELNSTTCSSTGSQSLFSVTFSFNDPDGDALIAGSAITDIWVTQPDGARGDLTALVTSAGGTTAAGALTFRLCTSFGTNTSIGDTFWLRDVAGNTSNMLSITRQKPAGANVSWTPEEVAVTTGFDRLFAPSPIGIVWQLVPEAAGTNGRAVIPRRGGEAPRR
jgi:hypothetical protein